MVLSPRDLGDPWHIALVRQRAGQSVDTALLPEPSPRAHRWAKSLDLSAEVVATMQPSTAAVNAGRVGWVLLLAGLLLMKFMGSIAWFDMAIPVIILGGIYFFNTEYQPRKRFQRLHIAPISTDEIKKLKGNTSRRMTRLLRKMAGERELAPDEKDALTRLYFDLVQEVMALDVAAPETQTEIRRILRVLGESMARAPLPIPAGRDEPADFIADAEMLAARAHREADTIVAESLLRQAEALLARARALENAALRARRTRALRDELTAQIEATRAALPHFAHSGADANGEWNALALSVRGIAQEAVALSDAHEELSQALHETPPRRATTIEEPQTQRLGRG